MTTFELATIALIAVAYLMGMLVRARRRTQMRAARLQDAADPARGGGPSSHKADSGHGAPPVPRERKL